MISLGQKVEQKNNTFIVTVAKIGCFESASRCYPLSLYQANVGHLKILTQVVSKDHHKLTEKDINLVDKMNFNSTVRISQP